MESEFFKKVISRKLDLTNDEYHNSDEYKNYISASGVKKLKKSPLHFKEEKTTETDAMTFGTAYHTFILEPELFEKEIYVFNPLKRPEPDKTFGSKLNSSWKNNIYLQNETVISMDDFEQIKAMKERLFSHRYIRMLFRNGEAEKSIMSECITFEDKPIKIKIRPDYLKEKKRIIVDLKTTTDASELGFQKNAANLDYHIQSALYKDIIEQSDEKNLSWSFIFVAQEKTPPYAFGIYEASNQFISQGRYEYEQLIMLYQHCMESGKWLGYQQFIENVYGIKEISLPVWAIREVNWYSH